MATGASNSDLAVILIDARKGVLTQTRRHAYIASLLGIRHVVLAVNKIDLVDFSQARVRRRSCANSREFAARLGFAAIVPIPISARFGDNVIAKSAKTPWYSGPPLLAHLETVDVDTDAARTSRSACRCNGSTGPISISAASPAPSSAGRVRPGDAIAVAKSGRASKVKRIVTMDGDLDEAVAGEAVTLVLADEIDISRGDMLAHAGRAARSLRPVRGASALDGGRRAAARPPVSDEDRHRDGAGAGHRAQAQDRRQHARASGRARRCS